jgi:hypothetical protein
LCRKIGEKFLLTNFSNRAIVLTVPPQKTQQKQTKKKEVFNMLEFIGVVVLLAVAFGALVAGLFFV